MAIAEKGLMVLDCLVSGKSAHAATGEGRNAIYEAMNDIDWFRNFNFEKNSSWLGKVSMQVTRSKPEPSIMLFPVPAGLW